MGSQTLGLHGCFKGKAVLAMGVPEIVCTELAMKNYWLKEKKKPNGGFPSDDALSLQQIADGDFTLDMIYPHQYIQNEVLDPIFPKDRTDNLALKFQPVLPGTMTGTVYHKGKAIQIFFHSSSGCFVFKNITQNASGDVVDTQPSKVRVTNARLNLHTGEISFIWNDQPGDRRYVLNYEYNLECQWSGDQ